MYAGATLVQARAAHFQNCYVDLSAAELECQSSLHSDLAAFLAQHSGDQQRMRHTQNIVKKCGCGKANARTLTHCNACGSLLPEQTGTSTNIFTSFIYGIGPFKISIRHASADVLVFDDMMQTTPVHFDAIPTDYYIQDWRWLLNRPQDGLALVNKLSGCCDLALGKFWEPEGYKNKFIHPNAHDLSLQQISELVAAGFNYPPSQFQLHLQYMLPPFMPYQFQCLVENKSFARGRFFPLTYVRAVLVKAAEGGANAVTVDSETPIDSIIEHFDKLGVSYEAIYSEFYENIVESHKKLSNWQSEDFELRSKDDQVFASNSNTEQGIYKDPLPTNLQDALQGDKKIIENYGRPYDSTGKPSGAFYKHARTDVLMEW